MQKTHNRRGPAARSATVRGGWVGIMAAIVAATYLAGCGSARISVEGYGDAELNHKRVFLMLPASDNVALENPAAYANSRGIAEIGATERIATELQSDLQAALDGRLDSNTVLEYGSQPVGAIVPVDPAEDFPAGSDAEWNWDKAKRAAKEGNIDFLIVLHSVRLENEMPEGDGTRGKEKITATFSLLDPLNGKLMTANTVDAEVDDPRRPADTFVGLSKAMAKKLPFHVKKD